MEGVHSFGRHFNFWECFRSIANCFLSLLRNSGSKPILWHLLSRKGRICVFEFPNPTSDKVAGQQIHLGSFDLEKYSQQIFSVTREFKDFFFLCSIPTRKEESKQNATGLVLLGLSWFGQDRWTLHSPLQTPRGVNVSPVNVSLYPDRDRGNQEAVNRCSLQYNQAVSLRQKVVPTYMYLRVPWFMTPINEGAYFIISY